VAVCVVIKFVHA